MNSVIPIALQIHFFSKNINGIGHMQKPNRTLLIPITKQSEVNLREQTGPPSVWQMPQKVGGLWKWRQSHN